MTEIDPEATPVKEEKPKRTNWLSPKKLVPILMVLVLVLAVGGLTYWWRDKQAKDQQKQLQTQIDQLKQEQTASQKASDAAKATTSTTTPTTTPAAAAVPTQALIDTIKAVFASGNSAALEGYMANPVSVIVAASEGIGSRTPLLATQDITGWMAHATDPWNFSLPSATLTSWRNGSYKQYFPTNAVVGKSDNMVIAFSFNSSNKISTVLIVNNVDVLTQ